MGRAKLHETEIKRRLTEGRNFKRLYGELRAKYDAVVAENKGLRQQLVEQQTTFQATIAAQAARIEQLEAMIFGRKPSGGRQANRPAPH